MMINSDLKRSFSQFKKHQEVGYLQLRIWHKILLSLLFFILLPTVLLSLFSKKRRKQKDIFVLQYTDTQPYKAIYEEMQKERFTFVRMDKKIFPRLPGLFLRDVWGVIREEPLFFIKNLYFFGAMAVKLGEYHTFIEEKNIRYLIVFQEYSFYCSYLTYLLESEDGALYNIQHGVPGETYCFFRFTKCFVWGEYFKEVYIGRGAEKTQFVVVGSIFHYHIAQLQQKYESKIDILYVMQGYAGGKGETQAILKILEVFASKYCIRILQHPRHRVAITQRIKEFDGDIIEAIRQSKIVVSHYSTALLDAQYLGKFSVAYIGGKSELKLHLDYLKKDQILERKEQLSHYLQKVVKEREVGYVNHQYIAQNKNSLKVIINEIHKRVTV